MQSIEESTSEQHGNLPQKTVSGLAWSLGTQASVQISRFLVSIVLARLLVPSDFGLLGMIFVFTGFASVISDGGFSSALVQRQRIEEIHKSTVFWLTCIIGAVLGVLTVGVAPLIAIVYREPRLIPLMNLIAIGFPISSLVVVQRAILSRAMRFRVLGLIDTGGAIVSGIIGIALALRGFGTNSLVWQFLSSCIFTSIATWWAGAWRPRWSFDRTALMDLAGFSGNLTAFSAVNYWFRNGDNLLVGRYFGSTALGIYARAYNLMLLPLSQVTSVVAKVMFPALSKLQNEKQRVKEIYLRMISIIALITFPLMLGLFATCEHFVIACFGPAWAEMIPVLRIFCVVGLIQSISSTAGLLYQSQGKTDWMFWWGASSGAACIAAIIAGVWIGSLVAIAMCLLLVLLLLLPPSFSIPGRLVGLSVWDVAQSLLGVLACATAMSCLIWTLERFLPQGWSHRDYLSVEVLFGVIIYGVFIHVFGLAAYRDLRAIMLSSMKSKASVPA